jgi:hypothetical protein
LTFILGWGIIESMKNATMGASEKRQASDRKAYERWDRKRREAHASLASTPEYVAARTAEGLRDAHAYYPAGMEPDNIWPRADGTGARQDPYAVAFREETTRIMQAKLLEG